MKKLKFITALMLMFFITFTSCQDELDNEQGENPNTNTADSVTANNLKRTSMYDGSFDDFIDGTSCTSVLLPVTATVNGQLVSIVNQSDYQTVINILGLFNNDTDTVTLQFPLTVRLSNYTEVVVSNQTEYNAIIDACEQAEANGQDAISCLNIDLPITLLTYSLNLDQTGSVVIQSEEQLYNFMNNLASDELFAVSYPITADVGGAGTVTISSDAELQSRINDCLSEEIIEEEAEENANILEGILVDGLFQVQSFVTQGIDTASLYADYTIDFANDLTITAENTVNILLPDVPGIYEVYSDTEVYLDINFSGNATFQLLNNTWEVTSYNSSSISLQSTTNPAITLVLTQI